MTIDFNTIISTVFTSTTIIGILAYLFKKTFEKSLTHKFNRDLENYKNELTIIKEKEILEFKNELDAKMAEEQEVQKSILSKENQKEIIKLKDELLKHSEKELSAFRNNLLQQNEKQKLLIEKQFEIFSEFVQHIYRIRNYFRDWLNTLNELQKSEHISQKRIREEFELFTNDGKDKELDIKFSKYEIRDEIENFRDASFSYRFYLPEYIFGIIHNSRNTIDSILLRTKRFKHHIEYREIKEIKVDLNDYIESLSNAYKELDNDYKLVTKILQDHFNIDDNKTPHNSGS